MPRYTMSLCGLEISFKTDADKDRIEAARGLLEERFDDLNRNGNNVSKDRLLACLALAMTDDYLEVSARLADMEARIEKLLESQEGRS